MVTEEAVMFVEVTPTLSNSDEELSIRLNQETSTKPAHVNEERRVDAYVLEAGEREDASTSANPGTMRPYPSRLWISG